MHIISLIILAILSGGRHTEAGIHYEFVLGWNPGLFMRSPMIYVGIWNLFTPCMRQLTQSYRHYAIHGLHSVGSLSIVHSPFYRPGSSGVF